MKKGNIQQPDSKVSRVPYLFYLVSVFTLLYGVITAYQMRWLCDDIFITLRYVQNWLSGNGIVYNVGERVEGYTHFLWLCLIALFEFLGSKPEEIVKLLGIISFAGTLVIYITISRKIAARTFLFIPLTALLLALNYDFKIWATSGLETSFFTFLVSASLWSLFFWKTRTEIILVITGLLLALAIMTRPDGIIMFGTAGLFITIQSLIKGDSWKQFLRTMLLFGSAFIVIYIPYFIWRYSYYGDIFPNTYYAKSGGSSYYSQGFLYIWFYVKAYLSSFIFLIGFAAIFIALKQMHTWRERLHTVFIQPYNAVIILSLAYILLYGIFFVARVGGDFMYARFLHPIIPMMYIAGEISLQKLLIIRKRYLQIAFIILPLLVVFDKSRRDSLFIEDDGKRKPAFLLAGISDEYWYWTQTEFKRVNFITLYERIGKKFEYYFRGEKIGVLLRGHASFGYYARFPFCVENSGLTDSYIAHQPIMNRGRPGHEKNATVDYLISRGVNFVFFRPSYDTAAYRRVTFRSGEERSGAEMFFYDAQLMNNLKTKFQQNINFVDFPNYLDEYLSTIKRKTKEQVTLDYKNFQKFYFMHNYDMKRERIFIEYLNKP